MNTAASQATADCPILLFSHSARGSPSSNMTGREPTKEQLHCVWRGVCPPTGSPRESQYLPSLLGASPLPHARGPGRLGFSVRTPIRAESEGVRRKAASRLEPTRQQHGCGGALVQSFRTQNRDQIGNQIWKKKSKHR
jgi:hypothetical protein